MKPTWDRERITRLPPKAKFPVSQELIDRQEKARAELPKKNHVRSLRNSPAGEK